MEVHLTPELERKLNDLAARTGRAPGQLLEDALTGYGAVTADRLGAVSGR